MTKNLSRSNEPKSLQIRNSTAEFLIFSAQTGGGGIEVRYEDETVWLTQKMMAALFDVSVSTVNEHLSNIFNSWELQEISVIRNFRITASDGKIYETKHYNLDGIIALGYRVNSNRAMEFRRWATEVLKQFAIKGYVLDKERLKNGAFLGEDYFENLLEEIREIRASERRFYQKITDIYSTAVDYDPEAAFTKTFFATVQNKMHYAIHGHTAAEIVKERADGNKPNMGLSTWKRAPKGKILKSDVSVAKNYLQKDEIEALDRIVSMYLDYAEDQATRKRPMMMEDWAKKLDAFLKFNEREVLENPGKVSSEVAKTFAESEFEKYRIIQDKFFESDFDREVAKLVEDEKK